MTRSIKNLWGLISNIGFRMHFCGGDSHPANSLRISALIFIFVSLHFSLEVQASGPSQIPKNQLMFSAEAGARITAWRQLQNLAKTASELEKLILVNGLLNRIITFVEDSAVWGQTDYWSTPMEAISRGAGDCEDFAIAKYYSLIFLGVPSKRLRLVYVRAAVSRSEAVSASPHMVVAYYPPNGGVPLILDNLMKEIKAASERPDLYPVFSFSTERIWEGAMGKASDISISQFSKWSDLQQRVRREGSFGLSGAGG